MNMKFIKDILNRNEDSRIGWVADKLSQIAKGKSILDAGAGEMRYRKYCSHLKYKSQDFCQYDGKGDSRGLQTQSWDTQKIDLVCDITSIPEADASFDSILCTEVIEHTPEPILVIQEFSRLLKKDGVLIITAPFASLTHFAPFHFYSGFNTYFYQHAFKKYGMEIIEIVANGNFMAFLEQEQMRLCITHYKNKSFFSMFLGLCTFGLMKVQGFLKSSDEFKKPDLLCFGYQIVARKI
jgi:ubiquinone/menaquinone biosynthesis C-methylase UbiE